MSDEGHAAVEFGLTAGLLLFPVVIAVMAFGPWSERRVMVEAAAAEAARAAVIALDLGAGADVVEEIAADRGIALDQVRLGWCGGDIGLVDAATPGCMLDRGSQVTATISVWAPLISTPWGDVGGLWVSGSHTEPIDLYRSLGET